MKNIKKILKILAMSIIASTISSEAYSSLIEEPKYKELRYNTHKKLKNKKFISNEQKINTSKESTLDEILEIVLNENEYIWDLTDDTNYYSMVKVITNGNKKLTKEDYDNLRLSGIPKIDLSNSNSDFIPSGAFTNATHLIEFKFPKNIQYIGGTSYLDGAFYGCTGLTGNLIIPDTVNEIRDYAFFGCTGLNGNLIIPNSVVTIGDYAFSKCTGLTGTLDIPNSIVYIGDASFYECSGFTGSLIIPDSVTQIGSSAFALCEGFDGNLKISNSLEVLNDNTFAFCSNFSGNLIIPNSIKTIEDFVFFKCTGFTGDLIIPNSIGIIGASSFYECTGFTGDLIVPNSVVNIKDYAFDGCSGFNGNLTLGKNIKSIGKHAFNECSGFIGNLLLPESLEYLGDSAFYNCSGFSGDLVIPAWLEAIEDYTFYNCSGFNGALVMPNYSLSRIGYASFYKCSGFKGDLKIPDATINIGEFAFDGCSGFNNNLILGKNVQTIGKQAFKDCSSLTGNIIIPYTVTSIDLNAFYKNSAENIFIGINPSDSITNYRKDSIDNLPDNKTVLDISYNLNISDTWLKTTNKTLNTISLKEVRDNVEIDLIDFKGRNISLHIPTLYKESNLEIIKDGESYPLPNKINEGKYLFKDDGVYSVKVVTDTNCLSNINFQVAHDSLNYIESELLELESSKDQSKFKYLRDLINKLPESLTKEQLQERLNSIFPTMDLMIKEEPLSSNADIYIKMGNSLSLSLNTNSINFNDVDMIDSVEKENALSLNIKSSLPYQIVASLESNIINEDYTNTLDTSSILIKENNDDNYKVFNGIKEDVLIVSNQNPSETNIHGIDLKLDLNYKYKPGRYKSVIKFEVVQK